MPMKTKASSPKKRPKNKSQYEVNHDIEQLIAANGDDRSKYTEDELIFISNYQGYGGIDSDTLTSTEARGSFTEFYTPETIVEKMWGLAYKYGFKSGQSVLEPSCGTGRFLKYVPANSPSTATEVSITSYTIAKLLYPKTSVLLQNFEQFFIKNNNTVRANYAGEKFDLVVGNPPYGKAASIYMGMGEMRYTKTSDWINYFITRGLDTLKPDGLLIYIIGTEVMNGGVPWLKQGLSQAKSDIIAKAQLVDAYRLPNGVFDRTDVLSDIIVLRKAA